MKPIRIIELLAEIKANLVAFFSIAMFVCLGIGLFLGIQWGGVAIKNVTERTYEAGKMHDIEVSFPYGITEGDIEQLKGVEGVSDVEAGYTSYASMLEGTARPVLKLQSLTERIDLPTVVEGRLPNAANEIALISLYTETHDVGVGDTIVLKHDVDEDAADEDEQDSDGMSLLNEDRFIVVGLVEHPAYISRVAGSMGAASIGAGAVDCVGFVTKDAFDVEEFDEAYPAVYMRCDSLRGMNTFSSAYQEALAPITGAVEELGGKLGSARYDELRQEAQDKIDEAQDDIDEADRKIADAVGEISDGEEELTDGEKEYADGEKEYADAKKELADAEGQLADGKKELDDAEGQLADGKKELDDAAKELSDAEGQLADGKKELDGAASELAKGKNELDGAAGELAASKKELEESEGQLASGKKELDSAKSQLDAGAQKLKESEDQLTRAKNELDAAKSEIDVAEEQIREGEAQLAQGRQEYEKRLAEYEQIKAAYEEQEALRGSLEQDIAERDATVSELTQQVADAQGKIEELNSQIAAAESANDFDPENPGEAYQTAVAAYAGLVQGLAEMQSDIEAANAKKKELQDNLAALDATKEEELAIAKEELATAKAVFDWAKETLDAKEEELNQAKEALASGKAEYEQSKAEYEQGKREFEKGQQDYEKGKDAYEQGKAEYEQGKQKYERGRQKYDQGQAEYDQGQVEYEKGLAEYQQGKAEYERNVAEYEKGRAEYEKGRAEYEKNLAAFREAKATYREKLTEYQDGVADLADARKELDQAKKDLEDARRELLDAKKELAEKRDELEDAKAKLADAKAALDDMAEYEWFVMPRLETGGAQSVSTISAMMGSVRWAMALLFVLIGLFVCYSAVSRLVNDEVVQIGTKKAVGFHEGEVSRLYLFFSGLAVLVGTLCAGLLAVFVVEGIMNPATAASLTLPKFPAHFSLGELVVGGGIEMVLILASTWFAIHGLLKRNAIDLLNGNQASVAKAHFWERTKLWQNMSLFSQTVVNNCVNDKRRVAATLIGVIGCTSLIVSAVTLLLNVSNSIVRHYDAIYDFDTLVYLDDTDNAERSVSTALADMGVDSAAAHVEKLQVRQPDGYRAAAALYVPTDQDSFDEFYRVISTSDSELDLSQEGIWVSEAYAKHMGLKVGDTVSMTEGTGQVHEIPLAGTYEYHLLKNEFVMGEAAFGKEFDGEPENNVLLVRRGETNLDDVRATLLKTPGYGAIVDDYSDNEYGFNEMASLLSTVALVYLALSALMAVVVLLNLDIMFVDEKKRELIILMINGFSTQDAKAYIYRDSIALTVIGIILGVIFGSIMGVFTVGALEPSYGSFIKDINLIAIAVGIVGSAFFSVAVLLWSLRRIPRFDLTDINRF